MRRSLEKRVEKIEQSNSHKNRPAPYLAIISEDGTVNVSHAKEDDFQLPNEEAFQHWKDDLNLDDSDFLRVIVVNEKNCGGEKPKEL